MFRRLDIREDDLTSEAAQDLLRLHLAGLHADTPACHVHALDLSALRRDDITLWTAWDGAAICGMAALRRLDAESGEIKSMRTHPDHLRRGVARRLLDHVIAAARARGLLRLALETGRGPAFEPALALYRRRGFTACPPFGEYSDTDFSQYLQIDLIGPVVRDAGEADLPAILAIYAHAVRHSTAVWSDVVPTLEDRRAWFADKRHRGFPLLVAEVEGRVAGFASYGDFRSWPGYRHTVEHSVYVDPAQHRRGIGRLLLEALILRGRAAGLHAMVAGIAAENAGSIALHARLGFIEVGRLPEVGRKFDSWLDLVLMQRNLE